MARDAVYANQWRIRGARGKRPLRRRGERLERPNAHLSATGRLRRVHLRGHGNILERLLLTASQRHDVGVVVLAALLRVVGIVYQRGVPARNLVRRD